MDLTPRITWGEIYRDAKNALRTCVKEAKRRAWEELLRTIDRDLWGRPYRAVMGRLRAGTRPVAEGLCRDEIRSLLADLFPPTVNIRDDIEERRRIAAEMTDWTIGHGVSSAEVESAVAHTARKRTAPGPDGIHGGVLAAVLPEMGHLLRGTFDACLREGVFPEAWKEARLVLVPKSGGGEGRPRYRPICVLGEIGKTFERIIASRIMDHLTTVGPDLCKDQFGFRRGRSTIDALRRVRKIAEAASGCGDRTLAVGIDIANAFNSLPWAAVHRALRFHGISGYLRKVVSAYLCDRFLECVARDGAIRREVKCGVPQGSVLGPLDSVVRSTRPVGCTIICYADDTLIVTTDAEWEDTRRKAEKCTVEVTRDLEELGLTMNAAKTEATWLGVSGRQRPPLAARELTVEDDEVSEEKRP